MVTIMTIKDIYHYAIMSEVIHLLKKVAPSIFMICDNNMLSSQVLVPSAATSICLYRIRCFGKAGANPSERIPSQGQGAAVWEGSGKLERIRQSGYHLKDNGQLSGKDQGSWTESVRADTISRTTGSCLGRIREAGANPSERIPSQGQRAAVWEGSGKLERILQSGYHLKDNGQLSGKDQGSWSESYASTRTWAQES